MTRKVTTAGVRDRKTLQAPRAQTLHGGIASCYWRRRRIDTQMSVGDDESGGKLVGRPG